MDISIPDTVTFYTQNPTKDSLNYYSYCFAHAVLRALEGENVRTSLEADSYTKCDDCTSFGKPQYHHLSNLRRP